MPGNINRFCSFCLYILLFFAIIFTYCQSANNSKKGGINILFLMPQNLGANNFLIRDVFEEQGWQVTRVAAADTVMPCGFWGQHFERVPIVPQFHVSEVIDISDYNSLFIATSPGQAWQVPNSYQDLLDSPETLELISSAAEQDLAVFAMCSGVRVLAAAQVISDLAVVGSPRFKDEYERAGAHYIGNEQNDTPPVISGNVITAARGQTYNYAIGQAVATVIEDAQKSGHKRLSNGSYLSTNDIIFPKGEVVWSKVYGGRNADGARAICDSPDGGYLVVGYTFAPSSHDADILAIKIDDEGYVQWNNIIGGAGTEYANGCAAIEDGYIITGYTTSYGAGMKDVYIIKIDYNGKLLWEKTFGGKSWDVGVSVVQAADGCCYVCGYTGSFGAGEEDIYVLKLDKDGKNIWSQTYGGNRIEMGGYITPDRDGGYIIAASSLSYGGTNTDFWLLRINSEGQKLWSKTYGPVPIKGHGFDWCKSACHTSDGGTVAVGYSDTNDLMDVVVVKADNAGNETWLKTFGNYPFYDYGNTICETADGSVLMAGITKSLRDFFNDGDTIYDNDIFVKKLDARGEIIWERKLGGFKSDWVSAMIEAKNGDAILVGHTNPDGNGSYDVCVIRVTIQ